MLHDARTAPCIGFVTRRVKLAHVAFEQENSGTTEM